MYIGGGLYTHKTREGRYRQITLLDCVCVYPLRAIRPYYNLRAKIPHCASEFKKFVQKWRVVAVPFFHPL
jgi:hypothetical protein